MFKEFPKGLFLGDAESECVIVHNAEEEAEKRSQGFKSLNEPQSENEVQKKRGRPRKEQ